MKLRTLLFGLYACVAVVGCGPKYLLNGTPTMDYTVCEIKSDFVVPDGKITVNMQGMEFSGAMGMGEKTHEKYEVIAEDTMIHTILSETTWQVIEILGEINEEREESKLKGIPLTMVYQDSLWRYVDTADFTPDQKTALSRLSEFRGGETDSLYPTKGVRIGDSWDVSPEALGLALGSGPFDTSGHGSMVMELKEVKEYKGMTCAVIGISIEYEMNDADGSVFNITLDGDLYRSLDLYEDLDLFGSGVMTGDMEGGLGKFVGPVKMEYVVEITQ